VLLEALARAQYEMAQGIRVGDAWRNRLLPVGEAQLRVSGCSPSTGSAFPSTIFWARFARVTLASSKAACGCFQKNRVLEKR
jgi:hypothetical protein